MTTTRRATESDLPFMRLVSGATPEGYFEGFPRDTDLGLIATREGEDAGAIWWRYFTASAPGLGFVDEATPELRLGIVEGRRGEGIANALVHALIAASTGDLSAAYDEGSATETLLRKNGFKEVGRAGSTITLLRKRPEYR